MGGVQDGAAAGSAAGVGAAGFLAGALRLGAAFFTIFFGAAFFADFIVFFLRAGAAFFFAGFFFAFDFFAMIVLPIFAANTKPRRPPWERPGLPHDRAPARPAAVDRCIACWRCSPEPQMDRSTNSADVPKAQVDTARR